MEMKDNQTFIHKTYINLEPHPFLSKNIIYFNDFQNKNSQFYD